MWQKNLRILVIKLGSSTLTAGTDKISRGKIEDIARQIIELREIGYQVVLVSSGAMAAAKQLYNIQNASHIHLKQAMAAIGQPLLMRFFSEVFVDYGLNTAQILLTYPDFDNILSRDNTYNTIRTLLDFGVVPIINENDTISTEEIRFGDNDRLAAYVAGLINAEVLVLASDIDGVYDKDPRIQDDAKHLKFIHSIKELENISGESKSDLGTGGIASKLVAAKWCAENHVEMWLVDGNIDKFVLKAMNEEILFTRFLFGKQNIEK